MIEDLPKKMGYGSFLKQKASHLLFLSGAFSFDLPHYLMIEFANSK